MGQAQQQLDPAQQDELEQPRYRLEVEAAEASHGHVPLWCWPLLAAAVCAVSSAAAVFSMMGDVPPVTLAAWRLQLTTVILACGACWQWPRMCTADKVRARQDWMWSCAGGAALAAHFACWVFSLQHTSITHAAVLVCLSPVLLVALTLLRRKPISGGEIGGSVLALAGSLLLAAGSAAGKEQEAGVLGDAAAFAAAVVVVAYFEIGRKLRTYQPIFVYAAQITGLAALLLTLAGLAFEQGTWVGQDRHGVFGWVVSRRYGPLIVYLGIVGGLIGHTGFNTVLKYITPLTVSLAGQMEPILAPLIGWWLNVMQPPGLSTYIGGALVLVATIIVIIATARRQAAEQAQQQQQQRCAGDDQEAAGLLAVERAVALSPASSGKLWPWGSGGRGSEQGLQLPQQLRPPAAGRYQLLGQGQQQASEQDTTAGGTGSSDQQLR